MSSREECGQGLPLTDEARQVRHFEETGEWVEVLPQRGTELGNPGTMDDIQAWLEKNWMWVAIGGVAVVALIILTRR